MGAFLLGIFVGYILWGGSKNQISIKVTVTIRPCGAHIKQYQLKVEVLDHHMFIFFINQLKTKNMNRISFKENGNEKVVELVLLQGETLEQAKTRICSDKTFLWLQYTKN